MAWGTERFIGGGMNHASIKVFDFRWTKGYYHTSGLPCLGKKPYPQPIQPFLKVPRFSTSVSRCNHMLGKMCLWHGLSREIYYRPNASFFLSRSISMQRHRGIPVWSLSRPSDVSPNFYVGIAGGIIEANLVEDGGTCDPNFGIADWRDVPVELGFRSVSLTPSIMETGDGLLVQTNDRAVQLPPMWAMREETRDALHETKEDEQLVDRHRRLDTRIIGAADSLTDERGVTSELA